MRPHTPRSVPEPTIASGDDAPTQRFPVQEPEAATPTSPGFREKAFAEKGLAKNAPAQGIERAIVEFTMREALASVTRQDSHEMILAVALDLAELDDLPSDPSKLEAFCSGPFYQAVHRLFGEVVAGAARRELQARWPALMATDSTSVTPLGEAASELVAHEDSDLDLDLDTVPGTSYPFATVLLLSEVAEIEQPLKNAVGPRVPVQRTSHYSDIQRALGTATAGTLVLVDARADLDLLNLFDLGEQLPVHARVVVWGHEERFRREAPHLLRTTQWLTFGSDAEPEDVGAMLSLLVG